MTATDTFLENLYQSIDRVLPPSTRARLPRVWATLEPTLRSAVDRALAEQQAASPKTSRTAASFYGALLDEARTVYDGAGFRDPDGAAQTFAKAAVSGGADGERRLHPMNTLSRRIFARVTGLHLPNDPEESTATYRAWLRGKL